MPILDFDIKSGHMCNGVWRAIHPILCSMCSRMVKEPNEGTHAIPSSLNKCQKCDSKWVTNGKCEKCGHVTEYLRTDRPHYNLNRLRWKK